jgi:hypothetical protein
MTCVLATAAFAGRQSSTDSTSSEKPAAKPSTKTTAKTAPRKHSKTPSKASSKAATTKSSSPQSANARHASSAKNPSRGKKTFRARGQQKIDSERARTIQAALIREHYLSGEPAGSWDQASEDAMRRYQSDHGWQTKEVPDARALISLGLGPSNDHLLNPDSAMTTTPELSKSAATDKPVEKPAAKPSGSSSPQ